MNPALETQCAIRGAKVAPPLLLFTHLETFLWHCCFRLTSWKQSWLFVAADTPSFSRILLLFQFHFNRISTWLSGTECLPYIHNSRLAGECERRLSICLSCIVKPLIVWYLHCLCTRLHKGGLCKNSVFINRSCFLTSSTCSCSFTKDISIHNKAL